MKNSLMKASRFVQSYKIETIKDKIVSNDRYQTTTRFIKKSPFASFFVALAILFGVIILGSFLGNTKTTEKPVTANPKTVSTYTIGASPMLSVQAKVEKSGVVKIFAQTAGVVQNINVAVGDDVKKGTQLIELSSNYDGGNAPAIQTALAQAQYTNVQQTFDTQKDLIKKQREVADKSSENTNALRDISAQSVGQTESLLNMNRDILASINTNLSNLENNNVGGVNDATILQTKQLKSQVESGVVQIEGGLRNLRYSTNTDNPPTKLADLQKDIALKQLDVQEKALDLSKKVSGLQVSLAAIGQSLMSPSSPFAGKVERVLVTEGQLVNPGTLLAIVSCPQKGVKLYAQVTREIAQSVSKIDSSKVHIQKNTLSVVPFYISDEATDGGLYTVTYTLPEEYNSAVTDAEYVTIDIPLGYVAESTTSPYIPIDSVFQTQDEAYVNLVSGDTVVSKKLELGDVYGKYVEVISGLTSGDKIILDRNVLAGDRVVNQ